MDALLKLVFDNFLILFAFAVLWNIVVFAFMLRRRRQRGLVFPKVADPDVIFSERFASGSSNKSWITRMGGASNCLTVIVTKTHIAITTFFPFTAFAGAYDLEHLIPIADITAMTPRGRITDVEFQRSDGTRRKISLRLRKTEDFLRALRGKTNNEQNALSDGR